MSPDNDDTAPLRAGRDQAALEANAHAHLDEARLPAVRLANEKRVHERFWPKMRRYAARLPFAEDLLAAYFCANDSATPTRVRATLFAALAYFIVPLDLLPDFVVGLGFTDDASVVMLAVATVRAHITPAHRRAAEKALADLGDETDKRAPTA